MAKKKKGPPRHPYSVDQIKPHLKQFSNFLITQGGTMQNPTNAYEVLRVKGGGQTHVLYMKSTGRLTWSPTLERAWACFCSGSNFGDFVKRYGREYKAHVLREQVRARDGDECFYCGYFVEDEGSLEHLLSSSQGGPNRLENLVLAHTECNREAGDRPLIQKIHLRESLRQAAECLPPWQDPPSVQDLRRHH